MILMQLLQKSNEIAYFSRSEPELANEYWAYRIFHCFSSGQNKNIDISMCVIAHNTSKIAEIITKHQFF